MKFSINTKLKFLYLLLAPLFVFSFNEMNQILPNSDGEHYLDLSLQQYNVFLNSGLFDGINSLYSIRSGGLRPLLFPSLVTPFMLISNGDIYLTVSLVMTSIALLWTYYCYKLISMTGNNIIAIFGAVIIVIWPGFTYYHYNFFSETTHIAFLTATIFYILNSNFFNNKKDTIKAGIFGGITLCVRPELLFIVPFGLIPYLYIYFKKNKNLLYEFFGTILVFTIFVNFLYIGFLSFVSPISNCAHCISNSYRSGEENIISYILIIITSIIILSVITYKVREKYSLRLTLLLAIILSVTSLWYFPYVDELFEWFRVGYFNLQDYNNPISDFKTNSNIIIKAWKNIFLVTFFCLLLSFVLLKNKIKKNFLQSIYYKSELFFIGLIITFIYFLLLLNESAGITPLRRTAPGIFLLFTGVFALLGSIKEIKVKRTINTIVILYSLLIVVHSTSAFSTVYNNYFFNFSSSLKNTFHLPWQHTVYSGKPKPHFHLVNEVTKLVKKNNLEGSYIYIPTFTHWPPDVTHGLQLAQKLLSSSINYDLKMWIAHPKLKNIDDLRIINEQITNKEINGKVFNYILIDTFPEYSNEDLRNKLGHHFYPGWEVLYSIRTNLVKNISEIDRIYVNNRHYILYKI